MLDASATLFLFILADKLNDMKDLSSTLDFHLIVKVGL